MKVDASNAVIAAVGHEQRGPAGEGEALRRGESSAPGPARRRRRSQGSRPPRPSRSSWTPRRCAGPDGLPRRRRNVAGRRRSASAAGSTKRASRAGPPSPSGPSPSAPATVSIRPLVRSMRRMRRVSRSATGAALPVEREASRGHQGNGGRGLNLVCPDRAIVPPALVRQPDPTRHDRQRSRGVDVEDEAELLGGDVDATPAVERETAHVAEARLKRREAHRPCGRADSRRRGSRRERRLQRRRLGSRCLRQNARDPADHAGLLGLCGHPASGL